MNMHHLRSFTPVSNTPPAMARARCGPRLRPRPRRFSRITFALLLGWAALASRSAEAADARDVAELRRLSLEDLMNVQVATVTTASKRAEKATAAPGTVVVIDRNDIRLRGYATLKDVVEITHDFEIVEV